MLKKHRLLFLLCLGAALFFGGRQLFLSGFPTLQSAWETRESSAQIQKNIARHVVRLHVIANSDSARDQALKLAVRDEIIGTLQTALAGAKDRAEAEKILLGKQAELTAAATQVLADKGCDAKVCISLEDRDFPVKQYGDLTFPAGIYRALCVEIGEAQGQNWWCVLFPSLCFVDETTAVVPDSSKESLKSCLTNEEYASLEQDASGKKTALELHFGFLDWLLR